MASPSLAVRMPDPRSSDAALPAWRIGEHQCTAGPKDRPFEERHDRFTIAAVVEGSFTYHSDVGRSFLYPGAFLLGNADACYECRHDHGRGDRCVSINVSHDLFAEIAASAAGSSRFSFSSGMLPADRKLLRPFANLELAGAVPGNLKRDLQIMMMLETIVATANRSRVEPARPSGRDERRTADVQRFIELNFAEDIDLQQLARVSRTSAYHFLRIFRSITGTTPYRYLIHVRLHRAARRIANGSEAIGAIAFDCGFSDLSTFNARFREAFACSPRVYRRLN